MFEEYMHKESIFLTFEGLKKEIAELGSDNTADKLLKQLLQQSLDAAEVNPSKHLDGIKGEKLLSMLPESILNKIIQFKGSPLGTSFKIQPEKSESEKSGSEGK